MIQSPIHKESRLLHSWMNQPFERIEWMTHKDIYHHLLADLVSYLEYNLINNNNNNNNKNIKRYSSLQKF